MHYRVTVLVAGLRGWPVPPVGQDLQGVCHKRALDIAVSSSVGSIIAAASVPLMLDLVPPNRGYGFRTRQTLADPREWFRANRFAGRALFISAALSASVFLSRPDFAAGGSVAGLMVFGVPLGVALIASFVYVRRIAGSR